MELNNFANPNLLVYFQVAQRKANIERDKSLKKSFIVAITSFTKGACHYENAKLFTSLLNIQLKEQLDSITSKEEESTINSLRSILLTLKKKTISWQSINNSLLEKGSKVRKLFIKISEFFLNEVSTRWIETSSRIRSKSNRDDLIKLQGYVKLKLDMIKEFRKCDIIRSFR